MSKINVKEFSVDVFCKDEFGIKTDYFMRDGVKWRVDYRATYNKNLNNDGTPFVCGSNVNNLCEHIYCKTFLVDEWLSK